MKGHDHIFINTAEHYIRCIWDISYVNHFEEGFSLAPKVGKVTTYTDNDANEISDTGICLLLKHNLQRMVKKFSCNTYSTHL